MNSLKLQAGVSLVEILVALVISLFLLGGIVQVYVGNKATFTFTNALAEIQENGRFALDTMSQDLRLANEWGCVPFDPDDTSNINNTLSTVTVTGYNALFHDFTGEDNISGTDNLGLNGSDMLSIFGGKPGQANVVGPFEAASTNRINVSPNRNISANDLVLIARCGPNDLLIDAEADIMRVTNATTSGGRTVLTVVGNKSQQFESDATVIKLQSVRYTIENSVLPGPATPTLIRRELGGRFELIEGVEDMQVLYGVDDDGDQFPNQYFTAAGVGNFDDVVSVRIMLLIRSSDDFVTETPQTFSFNGVTVTPTDRRIRQVFTTTIALRNRIGSS